MMDLNPQNTSSPEWVGNPLIGNLTMMMTAGNFVQVTSLQRRDQYNPRHRTDPINGRRDILKLPAACILRLMIIEGTCSKLLRVKLLMWWWSVNWKIVPVCDPLSNFVVKFTRKNRKGRGRLRKNQRVAEQEWITHKCKNTHSKTHELAASKH